MTPKQSLLGDSRAPQALSISLCVGFKLKWVSPQHGVNGRARQQRDGEFSGTYSDAALSDLVDVKAGKTWSKNRAKRAPPRQRIRQSHLVPVPEFGGLLRYVARRGSALLPCAWWDRGGRLARRPGRPDPRHHRAWTTPSRLNDCVPRGDALGPMVVRPTTLFPDRRRRCAQGLSPDPRICSRRKSWSVGRPAPPACPLGRLAGPQS